MKPIESVALATWILEHLTFGSHNEALSGDLLEEFRLGRSAGWYWRQVLSAVGVGVVSKCRGYVLPLVFAAGWSMFYPVWQLSIWRDQLTQSVFDRWSALDWPYSISLELGSGLLPAATFIWLGFFVYLAARTQRSERPSRFRILGSLSLSLNVLLLVTIGLLGRFGFSASNLPALGRESFYLSPYYFAISIPLALSLFSAILCALPSPGKRRSAASFGT